MTLEQLPPSAAMEARSMLNNGETSARDGETEKKKAP